MLWGSLWASWCKAHAAKGKPKVKYIKPTVWVGIVLIVLGALALAYQGFTYNAPGKGSRCRTVPRHSAGGIALIVVGSKKAS